VDYRQSPLLPVMRSPPEIRRASVTQQATGQPLANRKNDVQAVPLTATEPNVDSVFVPSSVVSNLRRNLK
jgi:hypothetical protein